MTVHIIGAGLAGCEAAWQLTRRGIPVMLHEMRPKKATRPTIRPCSVSWYAAIPFGPTTLKTPWAC